jgi:CheY-like chemotaxis protein
MPTVLVIDEDPTGLDFVRKVLEGGGHRVQAVTRVKAGLKLLAVQPFDAVVLEVMMEEKDGIETISELKQQWPARPIIAMTGGGSIVSAHQALMLASGVGADSTLQKPFSASELLVALDQVLAPPSA